jgi:mono/diheme cytochrome c family protein
MKIVLTSSAIVLYTVLALGSSGVANDPSGAKETSATVVANSTNADAMRVQGEQRFRANCGRCHAVPHKFPPRVMATVVRHMRVRATITDQDMHLILFYMTE